MTKATETIRAASDDAQEQIRQLRDQLDRLMEDRVEPAMRDAAASVRDAAEASGRLASDELDAIARMVRERPLTSLLAAAAVGFVAARLVR